MEQQLTKLLETYRRYGREEEVPRIQAAYALAVQAHEGQKRESGEPYVSHPLAVAEIVAGLEMDAESVVSALLHDTLEDTNVTKEQISAQFGENVAGLVEGLTKLARIPYSSKAEQEMENLRKMFIAMAKDIRVIVIKLADRLHNVRTLSAKPPDKQRELALETMDVYSPIAHRLGVTKLKWELEDLSLQFLDPYGYAEITAELEKTSHVRNVLISQIKERMHERFAEAGLKDVYIEGRVKHIYSIYRKMFMQNKTFDEVYDLYAMRVIVDTKDDCYNILGLIHDMYKPIPGRFKDYISTPKPNMYQSLHSTVIGREGIPFEVQIRTWQMHHVAEYGVAAHWKYKEGLIEGNPSYDTKLEWIRKMLENQQDADAEDFISNFKIDMFADEVYVFTPKGDVINLPAGATPIDFAYAIHSEVGNRMVGAKVNGRIVPIDEELQNGDIVEVLTSKASHGPSRDWLKLVRTSEARSKIKQWFKKEKREENIQQGRESLERELRRNGIDQAVLEKEEIIGPVIRKLSFHSLEELLAGIGYGGITVARVVNRLREECQRRTRESGCSDGTLLINVRPARKSQSGIIVEGMDSVLVKFARCCTPVPGDSITGFVTRGYGVSVHCIDCINVRSLEKSADTGDRFVPVSWADDISTSYEVVIQVLAKDREALIADLTVQLAGMHIPLHGLQTKDLGRGDVMVQLTISVMGRSHLDSICVRLKRIKGVQGIERAGTSALPRL